MNRLASPAQLRASLLRWSLFIIPVVMLLGYLSGQVGGSNAESAWFEALDKPAIFPPPVTFGIVWSILYFMMGLALAMVCTAWGARYRTKAIVAFVVQFALNLAWTPTFFAMHDLALAQGVIVALDVALAVTVWLFFKVRKTAGWLLVPYLAWVLFATVLNWQFLQMNPDADQMSPGADVQEFSL